jgi:ABC-type antimicrobial peptide transport system permease subunit
MQHNKPPSPPRWAERLLEWLAADHLLEEVQGDLQELFDKRLQTNGLRKARLLYILDLLKLIHPRLWRNKHNTYSSLNPIDMFQHFLVFSFRSFKRFKGSFFINLIGLSTGLACSLLIYLWVNDEWQMDKFHEKGSRLYQAMKVIPNGDGTFQSSENTSGLLAAALLAEFPQVEETVITNGGAGNNGIISSQNRHIKANGMFATHNFFSLFSYPILEGDPKNVLKSKHGVVVADVLAKKLFGTTENSIGKTIEWKGGEYSGSYLITGVFQKPIRHSSAGFDLLFNYDIYFDAHKKDLQDWGSNNPQTYLLLKQGTDVEDFNKKIAGFLKEKHLATKGTKYLEWVGTLFVERYGDKYLYNHYENGVQAGGRIEYVKLFSMVAFFILFIACINFMNLSTAQASRRMKEIGIKKAIGASRKSLMFQFLSESMFVAFLSLVVALLTVVLLLPWFNQVTGKKLVLQPEMSVILSLLAITLLTGVFSGSYPALYLSRFKPVSVLKGKLHTSVGEAWTRKGLVVFQFVLSVILIVSVGVIYKQMEYIQTKNLGYNKDNILQIRSEGKLRDKQETFLLEVKSIPGVVNASSMGGNMTGAHGGTFGVDWEGKNPNENVDFSILYVDYGLIELMDIELKEGRTFSKEFGRDSTKIIFNEKAIELMGMKNPVGKTIRAWGKEFEIIGVTKNFNFESLYQQVKPLFFLCSPKQENVLVKIKAGMEGQVISQLGELYSEFNGGVPFEYTFLDESYGALYASEQRVAVLSGYFAGIAIIISCLGLFGLAAFTAERRRKEIGIRKVLGSSELAIVRLLSGEFVQMVLVAILIALPVSYLIATQWLNEFAYAIDLEWWFFAAAGLLALLIAGLTVASQTLKASKMNPVKTLREN